MVSHRIIRRAGTARGITEVFLEFGCRKVKNGPTLTNRSSAEYDHVFWLKVDLEPAGPGLEPRRFSLTCDVIALSKIFQNV